MNSKIILLIEDNPDDEHLTLRALSKNNIMNEVVVAYNGQQALDYLFCEGEFSGRDSRSMPALIVLDLNLPGMTGLEALSRIRSDNRTKLIPVVVLTASEDSNQVNASYAAGANSYVTKPTSPSDFSDLVLNIGMYWLLLNVQPNRNG